MNERFVLLTSKRAPVPGARKIGSGNPNEIFQVTVVLKASNEIDREKLSALSRSGKAQRTFLTSEEHGISYGATNDAIQAISNFATTYGLQIVNDLTSGQGSGRRTVKLLGKRHAMESAFGTALYDYELPSGGSYRGRVGCVQPPADLKPYILAVLGLDNRREYYPRYRLTTGAAAAEKQFAPQDIAALYNFPAGDGAGQTVAIIELGGAFSSDELSQYFSSDVKVPRAAGATVTAVYVDGVAPVPYNSPPAGSPGYTGDDIEVMLDIEVVGAIAPAANIVVYFAENSGDQHFYNAVTQALHSNPRPCAISISWGGPEAGTQQTSQVWDDLAVAAAAMGTAIFVASGDNGASDQDPSDSNAFDGQRHVDAPADTPHVVACGGTRLVTTDDKTISSEIVWNDGETGGATGGGVSTTFSVPSWQTAAGCIAEGSTPITGRGVPDVSGNGDPQTGYIIRADGSAQVVGGTSAVAPLYTGLITRIAPALNGQIPLLHPLLYGNMSTCCNDITVGNNTLHGVQGYDAHQNWDACSGLGSPKGQAIHDLLVK